MPILSMLKTPGNVTKACSKLFLLTLCSSLLLVPALAQAHREKSNDKNGGHYDNSGSYHCHESYCNMAPSRYQLRFGSRLTPPRDPELFFHEDDWPFWLTQAGNCQTSRTQVLVLTSLLPVTYTNPRQCEVREGLWVDPYTGEEFTRAARLEIDHIIPPIYANSSNGFQWDYNTRANFANDLLNLVPVSRAIHRRKRDRSISRWKPRDEFLCDYATNWLSVAEKYDLDLFGSDRSRINTILKDCGDNLGSEVVNPE